ncbi:thioesterase family protein [Bacillus sp. XF8]|uniref:thioesterase family protein n=1 Tax=Bacillus sp. XF8 TaxID=2819289 RepID=UPI001AA0193A|nr:dihydrolipoamide acyltransferase [Bacillus sp. XF8]MBO1582099.1 dihydrolipoamide acyltransferase [Bacillus sp. XF8]
MNFQIDSMGKYEYIVKEKDLANNWENDVEVLATPVLLWLAEVSCMDAIKDQIEENYMSLGLGHYEMKHLAPSLLNEKITINSKLIEVNKNKLLFEVEAFDESSKILSGLHERAVVKREKFLRNLDEKRKVVK